MNVRGIEQGVIVQGVDEEIPYTLDVSKVGSNPTAVTVDVFREADLDTTVKNVVMPAGTPSVDGNVITLPVLKNLAADVRYRVEVKYTLSGAVFETYFIVKGEA